VLFRSQQEDHLIWVVVELQYLLLQVVDLLQQVKIMVVVVEQFQELLMAAVLLLLVVLVVQVL
jgi:hypothetical protein